LTANPLTGNKPVAGSIHITPSDLGQNGQCNAGSPAPDGEVLAWATNVQATTDGYEVTEAPSAITSLSASEETVLANDCSLLQQLGSGKGTCTCGTGD
jgi:voltage-gated potassium channel Kch